MNLADAHQLATRLIAEHGLTGWTVAFDRAKTRAGACRPHLRLISLSARITRLHSEAEVRDTVLHEIAHALVGPRHGHDEVWRAQALAIGCTGLRCVSEDTPRVSGAWVGTCPEGHVVERHCRPERLMSCSRCGAGFDRQHLFEWLHHGRPAPMHPNYTAALRALDDGTQPVRVGPGARVRVVASGQYDGALGVVVKAARTRYHVQCDAGVVLTVPFSCVERVRA